jgi:hypothetical protein
MSNQSVIPAESYQLIATNVGNIKLGSDQIATWLNNATQVVADINDPAVTVDLAIDFINSSKSNSTFYSNFNGILGSVRKLNSHVINRGGYADINAYLQENNITVSQGWADLCALTGMTIDSGYISTGGLTSLLNLTFPHVEGVLPGYGNWAVLGGFTSIKTGAGGYLYDSATENGAALYNDASKRLNLQLPWEVSVTAVFDGTPTGITKGTSGDNNAISIIFMPDPNVMEHWSWLEAEIQSGTWRMLTAFDDYFWTDPLPDVGFYPAGQHVMTWGYDGVDVYVKFDDTDVYRTTPISPMPSGPQWMTIIKAWGLSSDPDPTYDPVHVTRIQVSGTVAS